MMATWNIIIPFCLVLLLHSVASEETLLLNKCCPDGQQINDWFNACVLLPSADVNISESNVEQENITQVLERFGEDSKFPPWMDQNTIIYDPETEKPVSDENFSFLANASKDAILRYGHTPCERGDTKFFYSTWLTKYKLFTNGSIQIMVNRTNGTSATEDQLTLDPEEWCTDRFLAPTPRFVIFSCPCERITCVSRCCYKGARYVVTPWGKDSMGKCEPSPEAIEHAPAIYEGRCPVAGRALVNVSDAANETGIVTEDGNDACFNVSREEVAYVTLDVVHPSCPDTHKRVFLNTAPPSKRQPLRIWLQRDGNVLIEDFNHGTPIHRHDLCVDRTVVDGEEFDSSLFCYPLLAYVPPSAEDIYYSLLFLLGSFFLLLTLVVHIAVPALRRTAHAKALCCHCASLMVASVTLAAGHLIRRLWQPYCSITGFLVQFSFLATFFWLNVMCFDLSWTFSAMRRNVPGQQKSGRRFFYYSLYGWGFPALITAITLFMEFAPEDIVDPRNPMRPNIGVSVCSFHSKMTSFVYYYGPMALMQLINFVMFGWTVWRIYSAKRDTAVLRKGSNNARVTGRSGGSKKNDSKKAEEQNKDMAMYTKLFLLMGVTWLTETIAFFNDFSLFYFWYLTDTINLLRGIAIFILFCWKPPVVDPLRARARSLATRLGLSLGEEASRSGNRPSHTSVSTLESSVSLGNDAPAPENERDRRPQPTNATQESEF